MLHWFGQNISSLEWQVLLLVITFTSKVSGTIELICLKTQKKTVTERSKSLLGESPKFSIVLAVIVYGTALVIFNFFIRPGLTDPVLAVGVPLYIIWLTTTVYEIVKLGSRSKSLRDLDLELDSIIAMSPTTHHP